MRTLVLNIFLFLIIVLIILAFIILYLKHLENKRIKEYGEHYDEDHFREEQMNKEALITHEIRKEYQLDDFYRYKGYSFNSNQIIFFEGTRDDDKALLIDGNNKKSLKILTKRKFKEEPTKEQIDEYIQYLKEIDSIGILNLKEGYFVIYLIKTNDKN